MATYTETANKIVTSGFEAELEKGRGITIREVLLEDYNEAKLRLIEYFEDNHPFVLDDRGVFCSTRKAINDVYLGDIYLDWGMRYIKDKDAVCLRTSIDHRHEICVEMETELNILKERFPKINVDELRKFIAELDSRSKYLKKTLDKPK